MATKVMAAPARAASRDTALRAAAACMALSAATTAVLIGVPYLLAPAETPAASMARATDPLYLSRLVVGIVHPLLVLFGAGGAAVLTFTRAPARTVAGLVFFLLWAFTEVLQQALLLIALNVRWRREYLGTADGDRQMMLQWQVESVGAISDALFLVILLAFVAGNVLFATALTRGSRWDRIAGGCFAAGAVLGLISLLDFFDYSIGATAMAFLYPAVQPGARLLLGVWLWRSASGVRGGGRPD